jgi:diguanylate cyclase (GGDEF)-like protein
MRYPFLIVGHHLNCADFFAELTEDFAITTVTSGKEGLAALALPTPWRGVLAATQLPDLPGLDFLEQAAAVTRAIPLLLAPEAHLAGILPLANSRGVFRVVPENTPTGSLTPVFRDAVRQFDLLQQEHHLHARIEQLTSTDPLTGCSNRLHLEGYLKKELSRSLRYHHYLSVILCDIDGLNRVNETFGHQAGDAILIGFVRTAGQIIRQDIDTITRWGDDEFLFVLPETTIRGAGRVATRLQEQCTRLDCAVDGHRIAYTASFGVAGFAPEAADRNAAVDELLLIAERCLLQAKAAGGNQILCCP